MKMEGQRIREGGGGGNGFRDGSSRRVNFALGEMGEG